MADVASAVDNALDDLVEGEKRVVANQKVITESLNHALMKLGSASFFMLFHAVLTARDQFLELATEAAQYALDEETMARLADKLVTVLRESEGFLSQVLSVMHLSYVEGKRDAAFQAALADVDTTLHDFQAFLFLPLADFLNFLSFLLVAHEAFPAEPATEAALSSVQDVVSRIASVEKVFTMERWGVVPDGVEAQPAGSLLLHPSGNRLFQREGVLAKVNQSGVEEMCVWLFSDLLVLGYETQGEAGEDGVANTTYHIYEKYNLRSADVDAVDDGEVSCGLRVTTASEEAVVLVASSAEDRDSWVSELVARVDACGTAEDDGAQAASAGAGAATDSATPEAAPSAEADAEEEEEEEEEEESEAPPPVKSPAPEAPSSPRVVPVVVETSKPKAPPPALPPPPPKPISTDNMTPEEVAAAEARAARMKERIAARKARAEARKSSAKAKTASARKPSATGSPGGAPPPPRGMPPPPPRGTPGPPPKATPPPPAGGPPPRATPPPPPRPPPA